MNLIAARSSSCNSCELQAAAYSDSQQPLERVPSKLIHKCLVDGSPQAILAHSTFLGTHLRYLNLKNCWGVPLSTLETVLSTSPNIEKIDLRRATTCENEAITFAQLLPLIPPAMRPSLKRIRTDDIDIDSIVGELVDEWKNAVRALGRNDFVCDAFIEKLGSYNFCAFKNIGALINSCSVLNDSQFASIVRLPNLKHLTTWSFRGLTTTQAAILRHSNLPHIRSLSLSCSRKINTEAVMHLCHTSWMRGLRHLTVSHLGANFFNLWSFSISFPRPLKSLRVYCAGLNTQEIETRLNKRQQGAPLDSLPYLTPPLYSYITDGLK